MKFEFKNTKKVVFVATLIALTSANAKMTVAIKPAAIALTQSATTKKLAQCILAAKCRVSLLTELIKHEFTVIAQAFKGVKSRAGAYLAYRSLPPKHKKLADEALATPKVKNHLLSIVQKPKP